MFWRNFVPAMVNSIARISNEQSANIHERTICYMFAHRKEKANNTYLLTRQVIVCTMDISSPLYLKFVRLNAQSANIHSNSHVACSWLPKWPLVGSLCIHGDDAPACSNLILGIHTTSPSPIICKIQRYHMWELHRSNLNQIQGVLDFFKTTYTANQISKRKSHQRKN